MDLSTADHIANAMDLLSPQPISPPESLQTPETVSSGWDSSSSGSPPILDPAPVDDSIFDVKPVFDIKPVLSQHAPIDWKTILGPQPTHPVPAPVIARPSPIRSVIPPAPVVVGPKISSTEIETEAKFYSYAAFEHVFEQWKKDQLHPFRVASSETLKMPDGTVSDVFRYRYVVFNCAHYGQPRKRGAGKRPKQNYLPCGCRAMLRLNYNFHEQALKISTLITHHDGHEISSNGFDKLNSSGKMRASGAPQARIAPYKRREPKIEIVRPVPSLLTSLVDHESTFDVLTAKAHAVAEQENIPLKAAILQEQRKVLADLLTQQSELSEMFRANTLLQLAFGGASIPGNTQMLSMQMPSPPMHHGLGLFQGNMQQMSNYGMNQPTMNMMNFRHF